MMVYASNFVLLPVHIVAITSQNSLMFLDPAGLLLPTIFLAVRDTVTSSSLN